METVENYTVAVFEKYLIYYRGLFDTITKKFEKHVKVVHCNNTDLDAPYTVEYPIDIILFHIPLYMPLNKIKLLVKKIKEHHHEASIILYSAESRDDIRKNIVLLNVSGAFLLEDSLEHITDVIVEVLEKKTEENLLIKVN